MEVCVMGQVRELLDSDVCVCEERGVRVLLVMRLARLKARAGNPAGVSPGMAGSHLPEPCPAACQGPQ